MDGRQVAEVLAALLANATFADAPNAKILTSVSISRQDLGAFIAPWSTAASKACPFGVVRVLTGRIETDLATHASGSMGTGARQAMRASVWVVAGSIADPVPSPPPFLAVGNVAGDDVHGQGALVGKGTVIGTQTGQGADRIAAELVRRALGNGLLIDSVHGFAGRVTGQSDALPVYGAQLVARRIDLEITNGSTQESYHAPSLFGVTSNVAQVVTLAWRAVPARPDFVQYVLKRNGVTIYSGPATGYVDNVGAAGNQTYLLVASYDDVNRPATTGNRSSDPVTFVVAT